MNTRDRGSEVQTRPQTQTPHKKDNSFWYIPEGGIF
jgi:hypothetical protein